MTAILQGTEPSVEAQEAMTAYIVDAIIADAAGTSDDERCVGEPPSARYFLGALAPINLNLAVSQSRRGRETPNAAGFDFEVENLHGSVSVVGNVSVYYRVFPTFQEQMERTRIDPQNARSDYPLTPVFKRLEVPSVQITIPFDADPTERHGEREFADALAAVLSRIQDDPTLYRRSDDRRTQRPRVPGPELLNEQKFDSWCANLSGAPVVPSWSVRFSLRRRSTAEGRTRISLLLVNDSLDPVVHTTNRRREAVAYHDDDRDHFLFRTSVSASPSQGRITPIRMNLGPDAYRYDPELGAFASNCGVEWTSDGSGGVAEIRSTFAPEYRSTRIESCEHASTDFELLEQNPLAALAALGDDLEAYAQSPVWSTDGLSQEHAAAKARDRDAFIGEGHRFRAGVEWLRRDSRLLLAFRLTNRTMRQLGNMTRKNYRAWYLFQLVFLVSQLPALAWREHSPANFETMSNDGDPDPTSFASVLWFPTGGGKTEAYLGLAVCAMFYDRARGKSRGITAWCRLPLRLLTLQATQRQVSFIAAADEVRTAAATELRAAGGDPGDRFSVGVFMGESSTPNTLSRDASAVAALRADAAARAKYRVVDECPYCGERQVEIVPPDPIALRLIHRCAACTREIPVVVSDSEVYRYLPSFVVGTVDKLAIMGLTDKFGALLGDVDGECAVHGFGRGGKCFERRVENHPRNAWHPLNHPLYDASPSLEIIDELHMLREELGAFDGHYESGMAKIQRQLSARARSDGRGVRMKVVATTATIKGEDRQCEHLFGLKSVALPLPGPGRNESFYWRQLTDRPLRRFIGILPQRATAELTLVRVLIAFHRAVRRLNRLGQAADNRFVAMQSTEFEVLRDVYRVSLTYVTSLLDFGKIARSMQTQVNERLRRESDQEVRVAQLSADAAREGGIGHIRQIVDDLERHGGAIEAVLATSMIAHGVDIKRLNVMFFNGMPKSMAEYIQASSRVGRQYLGVVFMIFNPVRERDRSHFRYHAKFHEYLDRMVEPVAINRWSRYAARKTLPGVLMAELLQNINREWWDTGHEPRHLHDLGQMQAALRPLNVDGIEAAQAGALVTALGEAYMTDREEAAELRPELEDSIITALATIRAAGAGGSVRGAGRMQYRATGDHLGLAYEPMTSLRDVEEDVPIYVLDRRAR